MRNEIKRLKEIIKEKDKKIQDLEIQLENAKLIINDFFNKSLSNNNQNYNLQINNLQINNHQNNNPLNFNSQNNNPRNNNLDTINDSIIAFNLQEELNNQYIHNQNNQRNINNPPIRIGVTKTMTQNEIDRLGTEIYNSNNQYSTSECTFCMEDFKNGDVLRRLSCLHFFHKNCIDPWLKKNGNCPIDKVSVQI